MTPPDMILRQITHDVASIAGGMNAWLAAGLPAAAARRHTQ
jgi:rhodanese-related sulfurtransferase